MPVRRIVPMTAASLPDCRFCGCTNNRACPGGCGWVEPDLCSMCAGILSEPQPLVYLTARYSRLEEMNRYAGELRGALGYGVEARWLKGEHHVHDGALAVEAATGDIPDVGRLFAEDNLADLLAAHIVICFTEPPRSNNSRGGRHVEFGIALAAGKRIFVVGPRENVFYCLPYVRRFDDWGAVRDVLAER